MFPRPDAKSNGETRTSSEKNTEIFGRRFMDELKTRFPSQTKNFYATIHSCYEHSILKDRDSSIIMLVGDKLTSKNVKCVAKDLLKFINSKHNTTTDYNLLTIDANSYLSKNSDVVKQNIDEKLRNIFSNSGKVALINDIQVIPAKSMLLFYTYGDEADYALYKGILIIYTYELSEVISNDKEKYDELKNSYKKLTNYVEKDLKKLWKSDMEYDQMSALFTRVTNSVVLVENEPTCS